VNGTGTIETVPEPQVAAIPIDPVTRPTKPWGNARWRISGCAPALQN